MSLFVTCVLIFSYFLWHNNFNKQYLIDIETIPISL